MRGGVARIMAGGGLACLLAVLVLRPAGYAPRYLAAALPQPADVSHTVVFLTFGLKDTQPTTWDGQVSVSPGLVRSLTGWHFEDTDRVLSDTSWRASTRLPASGTGAVQSNGVFIRLEAPATSRVSITTAQGNFSFNLGDVDYSSSTSFLNGGATVTRVPATAALGPDTYHNDYPAVTVARDGTVWLAWTAYSNLAEQVMLRSWRQGQWSDVQAPSFAAGDLFGAALAQDAAGRLWLVWSANKSGNWDLYTASYNGVWSQPEKLTQAGGPNFFQQLIADPSGNLWLAWQGSRAGEWKILLKEFTGSSWSDETVVSASGDNWFPAIAADQAGKVYVGWDSYASGNFDVVARSYTDSGLGPLIQVAATANFEANVSLAVDRAGRLWAAWDESGAYWGKDTGFWGPTGNTRLYVSRTMRLACLENGQWKAPAADFYAIVPAGQRTYWHTARLQADAQGNIWMLFHRRFSKTLANGNNRTGWNVYATWFDGSSWKTPLLMPDSTGRNDLPMAVTADADGNVLAAWNADQRPWGTMAPGTNQVFFARFRAPAAAAPAQLQAVTPAATEPPASFHQDETAAVARVRSYRTTISGVSYRILRGDMHRHTDISGDGGGDGSLTDAYRYALDSASLDYLAVTDHNSGSDQEYPWWRTQKSADLFLATDRFVPLFAYERSVGYPNGHRNIIFPKRGVRTLPIASGEANQAHGAIPLYQYLTANGGIAMSHTSATDMGTDWRDNDVKLEPLVELYQGDRTNSEHEGAPRAPSPTNTSQQPGGFRPEGYVWNAWARGDRLGVQASSDHVSTHMSYACLYVPEFSRAAMFGAIQNRRAYAATDNIVLDVRMTDAAGEHFMGEEFSTTAAPKMVIKAIGSRAITRLEIIRNNTFVYSAAPGQQSVSLEYSDTSLRPGDQYYYVRVQQDDGQLAWSSPIWVRYRPPDASRFPILNLGGIANSAGFRPGSVAPGSLVSLFGTNLAKTTVWAGSFPLPTELGGTIVLCNGIRAPLLYVSPTQINLQVPAELTGRTATATVMSTDGLAGAAMPLSLASAAPGVFPGAVVHADGKPLSATAPARIGETLLIFGTGIGAVRPVVNSGAPAGSSPPSVASQKPTVTIGGVAANVAFAGLAPGFAGLFQINATVANRTPTGDSVALSVTVGEITSNEILLPVR